MVTIKERKKIYNDAVRILSEGAIGRHELVERLLDVSGLTADELLDTAVGHKRGVYRSHVGEVITEMLASGIIEETKREKYRLSLDRSMSIHVERCEREIIRILTKGTKTKAELRGELTRFFGTDLTKTKRDDGRLADFIFKTLTRLAAASVITLDGDRYSLSERAQAHADDLNALLTIKSEFLAKLHSKGGEFFEHYFMNLLSGYLTKHGYAVTECNVSGGTADGGIDGIIKAVDRLGFRETIMVQTKNRNVVISETDVRGFYGALCAQRGTRGIFATTSIFHNGAKSFLDGLDECVGVDADKIFAMALECLYGIKKSAGRLSVDEKII